MPQIRVLRRKDAPPLIRQQARVLLIGISLSLIGFVPLFWAPFSLHIRPLVNPQWGGIIAAFYPLFIGYAVLCYGLFDFRVVVRKGLAYSLLTAALTAIFLLLSLAIGYLFQALTGQQSILAALLPALFVAFLFQPVRGHVQTLVDRIFFRREYKVRQTLTAFGQGLSILRERSEVTRLVLDTVRDTLGAENARLWLLEDGRYRSDETLSSGGFPAEGDLVARLTLERQPAVAHRGESAAYDKSLDRAGVAVAVPLLVGDRSPHCTVLRVADDGQGFDPEGRLSAEHLGLWSIRERVRQFGGSFDLHSTPGQGTVMDLKVPFESKAEAEWTRSVS